MPSAELQTQISTEKTVSTGDEKLDYFMQKMRERVYASHLTEAKEEQEKNIGAKESKMAALDENPAVDIQNKGTENRAYSDKSKEKTERDPEKTESNLFLKDLKAKKVKHVQFIVTGCTIRPKTDSNSRISHLYNWCNARCQF